MQAFFSSTDDKSELTVPGLHIVVGSIDHKKNEYSYKASIVAQKLRKDIDIEEVVDIEPEDHSFHKKVLDYITPVVFANKKLYSVHNTKLNSNKKSWVSGETLCTANGDDWLEMMGITISDKPDIATPQGPVSKATHDAAGAIIGSCSPLLIDENGDPTPFFNSLDKTNSDLFDDPELEELYRNTAYDEEIANKISEWVDEGIPAEVIYRTIDYVTGGRPEEYADLFKEEDDK
jgi:hypothetical protein